MRSTGAEIDGGRRLPQLQSYVQCVYYICDPTPRGATVAIGMPQSGLARERGGPTRHRSTSAGGRGRGGREVKLRERLSTQVLSRPADQGHSVESIRAGRPARTGRGGCGETGRGSAESSIAPET